MSATTVKRDTPQRYGESKAYPMKASTAVLQGTMAAQDNAGRGCIASADNTLIIVGRWEASYDNSAGGAGAIYGTAREGVFRWANGDAITIASRGLTCYCQDNQTVYLDSNAGARPPAGRIVDVDSVGVWVEMSLFVAAEQGTAEVPQSRNLIAGAGLTGGGTLASDRTFTVGAGTGITVNADDVAITSPIAVTLGGLGVASPTDHSVLVGSGAIAVTPIAVGATGEVLAGATGADPAFTASPTGLTAIGATTHNVANGANATAITSAATAARAVQIADAAGVILPTATVGTTTTLFHGNAGGAGAFSAVALASDVSGTLPVANGGTGINSPTDHALIVGSGAAAMDALAVGATGTFLRGATGADPAWSTATMPNTFVQGDMLVATAANVVGVVAGAAVGSLLTSGGAGAVPAYTAAATNGQIPIGSTGAPPVVAAITGSARVGITNGAGSIALDLVDNGVAGNYAAAAALPNTAPGLMVVHSIVVADAAGATDLVVDDSFEVTEIVVVKTSGAGGAGDTVQVRHVGNDITDAMSLNLAIGLLVRPTTINPANSTIAAGAILRAFIVDGNAGATDLSCRIHVMGVKR